MSCEDTRVLESWGWMTLSSYWSSALDFESELWIEPVCESLSMSRRSLRLHTSTSHYGDDSLLDTSLNHSAVYRRGDDRSVKSRRAHHSLSGSIVHTPRSSASILQAHNSTVNSCATSDASLLSSLLDESSIQEHTLVDNFWGLDGDGDIKGQTFRAEHSTVEAKTQTSRAQNGYSCLDWRENATCRSPSSVLDAAGDQTSVIQSPVTGSCADTTVYCRDSRRHKTGVMLSVLGCCVWLCKRISVLRKSLPWRRSTDVNVNGGNEKYYSSMSVKEVVLQKERPKLSAVLCDDCKRKNTQPSQGQEPVGTLWSPVVSSGTTASESVLSLVNLFAQCLPMLSKLLFLLPFLLFLALWYWGPSGLLALFSSASHHHARQNAPDSRDRQSPADANSQRSSVLLSPVDLERFTRLEENMAQLWDRVAGGLLRQEEQHTEVLSLYNTLRVEFHRHTDKEGMAKWIGDMLEERFSYLKREVEKQSKHTQHNQERHVKDSQAENTRLAEVEALLQTLSRRTEELQRKQEQLQKKKIPETSDPDSDESDSSSSDAVLAEVKRLEDELERIRDNVQGLMGCRDRCEQLDVLQNSVSDQVEKEIKSLLYGSDKADEQELPDSLLQWLSDQFVSTAELQTSLRALENSILGNLSLQLEEGQSPDKDTISRTVLQAAGDAGLTEDHVQLIVDNALKLYSEDRTGLVDYALESGGGSIISTRCSETFETKTALMSLFGLPLWYFSQSPRVVIQPDVHPGNCWAFKGSSGFLVVGLSMKIVPTAFSLEHIPKALSPTGNISSAPRDFSVYGLDDEWQEEGQMLGQFTYEEDGDALQTFTVTEEVTKGFQVIEVRVLSNWGHVEYTCMYRFRVHGELEDEPDS